MSDDGLRGGGTETKSPPPVRALPVRATLFGTEKSQSTLRARANLDRVLHELGYALEAIETCDVLENTERAFNEGILATPTLVLQTAEDDQRIRIAGTLDNATALHRALKGFDHSTA